MARKQTIRSADSTIYVRGLDDFRAELKRIDTTGGEGFRKELGRANREIGELVRTRAGDLAQTKMERQVVADMKTSAATRAARVEIGNGRSAAYAYGAEFGAYRERRRLIKNTRGRATIVRNNEKLSKVIRKVESQTLSYDRRGGTTTVRKKARELAEKEENEDKGVLELLELSRVELDRIAQRVRSKVKTRSRDFDPFDPFGVDMESEAKYQLEYGHKPPTERQLAFLASAGFKPMELDGISRRVATKLIDKVIKRREANLSTRNQMARLHTYGVSDANLTFAEARAAMDFLASRSWRATAAEIMDVVERMRHV